MLNSVFQFHAAAATPAKALIDMTDLATLTDDEFKAQFAEFLTLAQNERRDNQLIHYQPVSPTAMKVHESTARVLGIGGGNRSSKTETQLIEIVMAMTGVFPTSLKHLVSQKFRGPVNCRLVLESLTTTLHPTILPKLQFWKWSGTDKPGGERGHWGWIPKWCLKGGEWDKSWSEKLRTLTVLCRDPENQQRIVGESTLQIMSRDQDPSDFASGEFHIVGHDEPPTLAIWRESEARVMSVAGRLIVAMTWPDDPSIPVDWLFDEVYEPGMQGIRDHAWFNMYTTDNKNIDQKAIAQQAANWSTETKSVRLYGQPIRFSNRVHPLFTDQTQRWCFTCGTVVHATEHEDHKSFDDRFTCEECGSGMVCEFNHVKEFVPSERWPAVWLLDPHPRKPHMFLWACVDPSDDIWVVADGECPGDPMDTRRLVDGIERDYALTIAARIIDPNMGLSSSSSKRDTNWQDEFDRAGLVTSLGDDGAVGRATLNTYLKPDQGRWQPRIHIHPRCAKTIFQMKRYVWADYKLASERSQRQVPRDKEDDMPTLLKYLMNLNPSFAMLNGIGNVIRRRDSSVRGQGQPKGHFARGPSRIILGR